MQTKKRFAYRVSPEADEAISATVSGDTCRCVGEVEEVSLSGATIRIVLAEDPTFAIGEKVTLTLEPKQMRSVQVLAVVRSRTELDGSRSFGFEFPNPAVLRARLSAGLLRLFNERQSFRVEPGEQDRVEVRVAGEGFVATGLMRDISADGVGVVVDLGAERGLAGVVRVNVEFQLPGQDRLLAFQATIPNRYKLARDETVCIGLHFDAEASPDYLSQQRRVTDYVVSRQRALRESLVET